MIRANIQSLIPADKWKAAHHRFALRDDEIPQFERVRNWLIDHKVQTAPANNRTSESLCAHVSAVLGEPINDRVLGLALLSLYFHVYSISSRAWTANVAAAIFNITEP